MSIDRIRIICTVYDPTTGKYRYDYGLIPEIAGGATFARWPCAGFCRRVAVPAAHASRQSQSSGNGGRKAILRVRPDSSFSTQYPVVPVLVAQQAQCAA